MGNNLAMGHQAAVSAADGVARLTRSGRAAVRIRRARSLVSRIRGGGRIRVAKVRNNRGDRWTSRKQRATGATGEDTTTDGETGRPGATRPGWGVRGGW